MPQNLSTLWDAVVKKTQQRGFQEFEDVFLVVVFDSLAELGGAICANLTYAQTQEESLKKASKIWNDTVDMRYVPKGNMEYRVESTWRV